MKIAFCVLLFAILAFSVSATSSNDVCDASLRAALKQPEGAAICNLCKDVVRLAYRFSNSNEAIRSQWATVFPAHSCSLEDARKGDCKTFSNTLIAKKASFFQSEAAIVPASTATTDKNISLDLNAYNMCLAMSCCESVHPSTPAVPSKPAVVVAPKVAPVPASVAKASFLEFNATPAPAVAPVATTPAAPVAVSTTKVVTPVKKVTAAAAVKKAAKKVTPAAAKNATTPVKQVAKNATKPAAKKNATTAKKNATTAKKNATVAKKNVTVAKKNATATAAKKNATNAIAAATAARKNATATAAKVVSRIAKSVTAQVASDAKRVLNTEINIVQAQQAVNSAKSFVEKEKVRLSIRAEALEDSRKRFDEERNQVESIRQKLQLLYLQNAEAKKVVSAKASVLREQEVQQRKKQTLLQKLEARLSQQEKGQVKLQRKLQAEQDKLKKAQDMINTEADRLKRATAIAEAKTKAAEEARKVAEVEKRLANASKETFDKTIAGLAQKK